MGIIIHWVWSRVGLGVGLGVEDQVDDRVEDRVILQMEINLTRDKGEERQRPKQRN